MKKKPVVKKKTAIRTFKNGTADWTGHQIPHQIAAEQKQRKERQAMIERSKKSLRCFPDAEEYLTGGMDILTAFVESNVSADQDRKYTASEKRTIERLGRLIAEHLALCIDVLSTVALCGERNAIRASVGASVHLANIIEWIGQNKPEHIRDFAGHPAFSKSLRAWAKHGEIACDSVLKLKHGTKVKPATPATRLVWDFMRHALRHRSDLIEAAVRFNLYQHVLRQKTLTDYLLDHCGGSDEKLIYKDLPDFTRKTVNVWWEKALKPLLDEPGTLDFVRRSYPIFYRELRYTAVKRGSSKESAVNDLLKKRCQATLWHLAAATSVPQSR